MRDFNYSKLKDIKIDQELSSLIASIYRYSGKQDEYLKRRPKELEKLVEIAKIQSTESSNEIEGIVTTNVRLKQLVQEKTTPRNRDEEEIAGYRDVLNMIHESFEYIYISKNYILQLHKNLFRYMSNNFAGKTKSVQNYISQRFSNGDTHILFTPLSPFETHIALDKICEEYNKVISNNKVEPLILILIFIHDFLCIHPFNDGNGRMSRLLTTLLLYRSGFQIGKFISLESKISKNKDLYYEALRQSGIDWHEAKEKALPFIKYILSTILASYKDLEDRYSLVENKLPAIEIVIKALESKIGKFNKQDVLELCPSLSLSSVEGSIRKLVKVGKLARYGSGRATYYIKINW